MGLMESISDKIRKTLSNQKTANAIFWVGILLLLVAAYVAFWSLHPVLTIELIFMTAGTFLIILRVYFGPSMQIDGEEEAAKAKKPTIAQNFIRKVTLENRLIPHFPMIGILLLLFVYLFNVFISSRSELGNGDYLMIALALLLIFYNIIPLKYRVERDFAMVFLILILLLLIIPLVIYGLFYDDPDFNSESPWVHYFVSVPASLVANAMGIDAHASFSWSGAGSEITFTSATGESSGVAIALGCSGLYSVMIFFCAYMGFMLTNFSKINRKLVYVLVLGLAVAWFANLIRIALTIGAGAWWGVEALTWFHENIGIFIFLGWTAIFWYLIFRFIPLPRTPEAVPIQDQSGNRPT
jgi:exosortase/archaeosortase family protein